MNYVTISNLTLFTPDGGRVIIGDLLSTGSGSGRKDGEEVSGIDVEVLRGDRVLVVGSSGSGKSSLVRALAGLWKGERGIALHHYR